LKTHKNALLKQSLIIRQKTLSQSPIIRQKTLSQSPIIRCLIFTWCENRMVLIIPMLLIIKIYIKRKIIYKKFKGKIFIKTIGSSSIITKGNSQSRDFTSHRQTFMTINTNQKPDKYEPIKAVVPIMKGF
jgi:hypothetical protein